MATATTNNLNFVKILKIIASDVIYILVLLILWSVAFWDISNIVKDYLYENRNTLVTAKEINMSGTEPIPFLEDVEICIRYRDSIFNQFWLNDSEVDEFLKLYDLDSTSIDPDTIKRYNITVNIINNINISNVNEFGYLDLTKEEILHSFLYLKKLNNRDLKPNTYATEYYNVFMEESLFYNLNEENFGEKLKLIERTVNSFLQGRTRDPSFVIKNYTIASTNGYHFIDICRYMNAYKVPLVERKKIFGKSVYDIFYLFGGVIHTLQYWWDVKTIFDNTAIIGGYVRFPNTQYPFESILAGESMTIKVDITNLGIYDKTNVNDYCLRNSEQITLYMDSHCKYSLYMYVSALQKFCHCTPFSFRNHFPSLNDHQSMKYCANEIYNSTCMTNVPDSDSSENCPEPCRKIKNKYDINAIVEKDLPKNTYIRVHSRIQLIFTTDERLYTFYEEKIKSTAAQFVAQVGGDIGIYTGFSILALWQFLIFLYNHWKKRSQMRKNAVVPTDPTESWFQAIMCYLETRGCKYDEHESNSKNDLKNKVKRMTTKLDDQEKTALEQEKKIQKLESELSEAVKSIKDLTNSLKLHQENLKPVVEEKNLSTKKSLFSKRADVGTTMSSNSTSEARKSL